MLHPRSLNFKFEFVAAGGGALIFLAAGGGMSTRGLGAVGEGEPELMAAGGGALELMAAGGGALDRTCGGWWRGANTPMNIRDEHVYVYPQLLATSIGRHKE